MKKKKPITKKAVKKVATFESVLKLLGKCVEDEIGNHNCASRLLAYADGDMVLEDGHDGEQSFNNFAEVQEHLENLIKNSDYKQMFLADETAKVYFDRIEVGCKTVFLDEFDELAKLVAKMRK